MSSRKSRLLFSFVWSFISVIGIAQEYTVTDLGPLAPTGINSWAQVVGNYNSQAYIWSFGRLQPLGLLPSGTFSNAAAIDDLGQVVGQADFPAEETSCPNPINNPVVAFLWNPRSGMQDLGTLGFSIWPPCDFRSYASGLNLLGTVVGTVGNPSTTYVDPFIWTNTGGMTVLSGEFENSLFYLQSTADGVNNLGQVVGKVGVFFEFFLQETPSFGDEMYAYLWDKGVFTDLGGLSGNQACSEATDINDLGHVVGWSNTTGHHCSSFTPHAFLWTSAAGIQDLGTLPGAMTSEAYKINLLGQVIGSSDGLPFIWTQRSGMRNLNTLIPTSPGWTLNSATAINLWGQIVGQGTRNGQLHGYLLTPMNPLQVF